MENIKLDNLNRWERRWIEAALENATMSKDPGTKCGAVIVDPTGRWRVSEGFNGLPQRITDTKAILLQRSIKLSSIIHAEMNAILFAECNLSNHIMFTTHPPCDRCSAHIIQVDIKKVYWWSPSHEYWNSWRGSIEMGRELLSIANLEQVEIGP